MADILTRDEVELVADGMISKFLDPTIDRLGVLKFDFLNSGYQYFVTYLKNSEGYWRLNEYNRTKL